MGTASEWSGFMGLFLFPIEDMMQLAGPQEVLKTLTTIWKITMVVGTLQGGWAFGYVNSDYSKMKYYDEGLDVACTIIVLVIVMLMLTGVSMNLIFLIESSQWTRAVDQRWWLTKYHFFFKVPAWLFIQGYALLVTLIVIIMYMKHGATICYVGAAISFVLLAFVTILYFFMCCTTTARLKNSVLSLNTALKVFSHLDEDNNGHITLQEWQKAVGATELQGKIHVPKERLSMAFPRITGNGSHMSWHDFISNFAPMGHTAET